MDHRFLEGVDSRRGEGLYWLPSALDAIGKPDNKSDFITCRPASARKVAERVVALTIRGFWLAWSAAYLVVIERVGAAIHWVFHRF
jgi:hypothetical protein